MVLHMSYLPRAAVMASVVFGCILTGPQAYAGRLVSFDIELDDRRVFDDSMIDNGLAAPGTMWRYLKFRPVTPSQDFAVPVHPDRPLETILKGKICVSVSSVDYVYTNELKLTRLTRQSNEWFVDPEWVEKNGPPADVEPDRDALESLGVIGTFLPSIGILSGILCLAATIALWRRARKSVRVRGKC